MNVSIKQVAAVLVPSLIAVAIGYSQYQPQQPQPAAPMTPSELAPISLITLLPYPEFDNLTLIARNSHRASIPIVAPIHFAGGEVMGEDGIEKPLVSVESATGLDSSIKPVASDTALVKPQVPASDGVEFEELDLSSLSPELAKQIQDAFTSTDALSSDDEYSEREESPLVSLPDESARFTGKLPAMNLQTHMFASNQQSRWIKVNGKEVHEGEWITPQVQLVTINPRNVVIRYEGEQIEMPALYEWRG